MFGEHDWLSERAVCAGPSIRALRIKVFVAAYVCFRKRAAKHFQPCFVVVVGWLLVLSKLEASKPSSFKHS